MRYFKTHEWITLDADGIFQVGISEYAQESLGDIVFIELPEVGSQVRASDEVCVIESVKTASDIYAPISGKIVEVNSQLENAPELVNQDPTNAGWIFKIVPEQSIDMDSLEGMNLEAYLEQLEN